jgi:hypothetical protein
MGLTLKLPSSGVFTVVTIPAIESMSSSVVPVTFINSPAELILTKSPIENVE